MEIGDKVTRSDIETGEYAYVLAIDTIKQTASVRFECYIALKLKGYSKLPLNILKLA